MLIVDTKFICFSNILGQVIAGRNNTSMSEGEIGVGHEGGLQVPKEVLSYNTDVSMDISSHN